MTPIQALDVLRQIRARGGAPLTGYKGGGRFVDRDHNLPAGDYRKYDIHPHIPGANRGPERLIIEQGTGQAYFTGDHYRTFETIHDEA